MFLDRIKKIINISDFFWISVIIFLVPLFFSWFFWSNSVFEINKSILFKILIILTYLFLFLKFFVKSKIKIIINKYVIIFTILLFFSFLISFLFSEVPLLSFWGSYSRQQGFYSLVFYLLFFLFLNLNLKNLKQIHFLLSLLIISSTLVCIYGVFQLLGVDYIIWKEAAVDTRRIFSSLGQPNLLGHFLVLIIPIIFYHIFFRAKNSQIKFIFSLIILLHIFCLYFTYSRSAWLAFLVSSFVSFLIWLFLKGRKKLSLSLFVLSISLILIIILFGNGKLNDRFANSDSLFLRRIVTALDFQGGSVQVRLVYWKTSLKELKNMSPKRLVFGYGPDSLYDVFARNYRPSWAIHEKLIPDRAHNLIFDIILQFGLFGLAIWLCFFIFLIKKIVNFFKKYEKDSKYYLMFFITTALIAYFINNLFNFSLTTNFIVFYLFIAIIFFLLNGGREKEIKLSWSPLFKFLVFLFLSFFLIIIIFYYNIRFIVADNYFFKANRNSSCIDSWDDIFVASQKNPFSLHYKNMLMARLVDCTERANTSEDVMSIRDKINYSLDYTKKDEGDFNFLLNRATIAGIAGGDYEEFSLESFSYLENNYRFIDLVYQYRAYQQITKGDHKGAIETLKKGLISFPSLEEFSVDSVHKNATKNRLLRFYELIAWLHEVLGDNDMAIEYYEDVLSLFPSYLPAYDRLIFILEKKDERKYLHYKEKRKEYE